MNKVRVTLELSPQEIRVLGSLGQHSYIGSADPGDVLRLLIHHVLDGARRPGSWERGWMIQLFGDGWESELTHMEV